MQADPLVRTRGFRPQTFFELAGSPAAIEKLLEYSPVVAPERLKSGGLQSDLTVASLKAAHASSDRDTATEPISNRLFQRWRFAFEKGATQIRQHARQRSMGGSPSRSRFSTEARAAR